MHKRQKSLGSHHSWHLLTSVIFTAASLLSACGTSNTGTGSTTTPTSTQTLAHLTVYATTDGGILRALKADTGQLRWQGKTGQLAGGKPVVENGIVYAGGPSSVYAFKASDGTLLWSALGYNPDIGPVVADGKVFVNYYTSDGPRVSVSVAALKGTDGSQLWSKQIVSNYTSPLRGLPTPGTAGQLVANGVFYTVVLTDQFHLYAFNANNGELLWQSSIAFTDGQKTSLFAENGVVFVYLDRLYAYQASNGKLLWQSQGASQRLSGSHGANAAAYGDLVVNPGPKGTVYTETFDGLTAYSTDNGSQLWHVLEDSSIGITQANGVIYAAQRSGASALDARTGKLLWSYKVNDYSGFIGPLTDSNTLYIHNFVSGLVALDIHTGNLRWRAQAGGNGIEPTLVDGTLFIGDGEGTIAAVRATDGKILWRFPTSGGMSFPSALTVA